MESRPVGTGADGTIVSEGIGADGVRIGAVGRTVAGRGDVGTTTTTAAVATGER